MKPCGYYVLVKVEEVEVKSASGIIIQTREGAEREFTGQCIGQVQSFGPLAFKGLAGGKCKTPKDWGVEVGDMVEFNRYDGKVPHAEGFSNYRLIQDEHIWAVIKKGDCSKKLHIHDENA
ncbi:MAG: hypothetical protein Unbinned6354contig1000_21 [Prokaryotic dsDNA virus sp.]|nr:hypothetical protein [Cytophagaceae bacterium]QDP54318.1 MAG: hypothetical protein Unbinned6354contig1000_21 [Prokaryotic dsDNA virus sp.]|tara:strand:+ start:7896 stop:8255 length:360 start_codon:yes stop_codon:yes gene_type:complete